MNIAYLCLGGNIGDREALMKQALELISERVGPISKKSAIYETEAWGVTNQQAYLNQCISVDTKYNGSELIHMLLDIEKLLGRERNLYHTYEPRTIDIDILFYNDDIIHLEHLTIPHPRLHLRKFVLQPLSEIAKDYIHPVLDKTVLNLLDECVDNSEVNLFKMTI